MSAFVIPAGFACWTAFATIYDSGGALLDQGLRASKGIRSRHFAPTSDEDGNVA